MNWIIFIFATGRLPYIFKCKGDDQINTLMNNGTLLKYQKNELLLE